MVDSSYFIGGYAIHGYADVPNYPASHGCLRVPIPNARQIYDWVDIGDPIFVYASADPYPDPCRRSCRASGKHGCRPDSLKEKP